MRVPADSDPTRPLKLGPFVLQDTIGRGGMGQVWRGWHYERGVPVAVKVLDASGEDLDRNFRNEVQAVARLDHPGVVWVYDVGQIDPESADGSRGRLTKGAPYIAMEFATRGTIRDWGRIQYGAVREVLLSLLDALSHAHARGVIHRDLKPANVLVCGPEDLRPGLKLADFGIAHAIEHNTHQTAAKSKTAIGTVQYMAPEQIRVEHQDTGPWTDIYALGNVTWQLLTGRIPFANLSGVALVRAQLDENLPDPVGARVPDGFLEWLRRCVAKNPVDRFQRCADAADALMALPDLPGEPSRAIYDIPGRTELAEDGIVTSPITGGIQGKQADVPLHTGLVSLSAPPGRTPDARRKDASGRKVRNVDWRRPDLARPSFQLLGAGLALYDVRQPPLVGRIEERDRLWQALHAVSVSGKPDLVLVHGPTGTGKSRLLRWLGERAHELGVATPLTAKFFEEDSTDGAVRRMWARHLRMAEVEQSERGRWLVKVLGRLGITDVEQYAVLIGPGSAEARRKASEKAVRALARERPVIVLLDDVDADADGLRLADHLVSAPGPLPVLVVAAARSERMAGAADTSAMLDDLSRRFPRLELGPLPPRDQAALIEEVLGLSPVLASQVTERTGGNPRFARKLIGDWVKRGALVLGPTGFEVRQGEVLDLPESLRTEWVERLRRLLHGLPEKAHLIVERAAVLGLEWSTEEWTRACDDPDAGWVAAGRNRVVPENERLRNELVQRLGDVRLIEPWSPKPGGSGHRFVHGMIREVLLERAKAAGRLAEHHQACANILRFAPDQDAAAERIGRHLQHAGKHSDAIGPLLQGVMRRRDTAGARSALGLVATVEEALRSLGAPDDDARWAESLQLRAMLSAELGEIQEAERIAAKVIQGEGRPGWAPHALDARMTLARIRANHGQLDLADRALLDIEERASDPVQQGLASAERALIAARRRRRAEARDRTDNAIRKLRRAASSRALAECWRVVGTTAVLMGNERQAEDALSRGLKLYESRGNLVGQADCLAGLARNALARQDLERSEQFVVRAIQLYDVAGMGEVVRPKADLARIRLEQGRGEEGRDLLLHVRHAVGRMGTARLVEGLGALQLLAAAQVADWDEFDHRLKQIEADPGVEVGEDGIWALDRAAQVADRAGVRDRAVRAAAISGKIPKSGTVA